MNPRPTARERRLLALAKCWKKKAIEAEKKEKESQKQLDWVYRQSLAIAKNIHGEK